MRDDDKTIVVTRNQSRKVLVFGNDVFPAGWIGATGPLVMRHAADLGTVRFVGQRTTAHPGPFDHASIPEWSRGHEGIPIVLGLSTAVLHAERSSSMVIAGPVTTHLRWAYRHEWILVGTRAGNAKIVSIKRPSDPATQRAGRVNARPVSGGAGRDTGPANLQLPPVNTPVVRSGTTALTRCGPLRSGWP